MVPRRFFSLKSTEVWIAATLLAVAAILAVVNRDRRHIVANEASALGVLRTMNMALAVHAARLANGGAGSPEARFPATLLSLQVKPTPPSSAESPDIFDAAQSGVAGGTIQKNGYVFVYQPGPQQPGGAASYSIVASPLDPGHSGARHFYTNQHKRIYDCGRTPPANDGGAAPPHAPPPGCKSLR